MKSMQKFLLCKFEYFSKYKVKDKKTKITNIIFGFVSLCQLINNVEETFIPSSLTVSIFFIFATLLGQK